MAMFLITAVVFALALGGMAIGVMLGGKPIKGSCGGINNIKGLEGSSNCGCEDPCELKKLRLEALAKAEAEG